MGVENQSSEIAVVIPVWDEYVQYLEDAIRSVRAEGTDTLIVIVDNASTMPVETIAEAAIVRAPRRLSVGAARNLGLAAVDTPFVLVLDADDTLLPGTLTFLHCQLKANSDVAFCTTSIFDGALGTRHRVPRRSIRRVTRWHRVFA